MIKVILITNSTMGSTEYVAEHIAEIFEKYGFDTEVTYDSSLKKITNKRYLVIWLYALPMEQVICLKI